MQHLALPGSNKYLRDIYFTNAIKSNIFVILFSRITGLISRTRFSSCGHWTVKFVSLKIALVQYAHSRLNQFYNLVI